jgi:pyrroline-5-carboxylate reductase
MKILIIGGGNMGKSFIESFLKAKLVLPTQITVVEKSLTQQDLLRELNITQIYTTLGNFVTENELIILATKPQDAHSIYPDLKKYLTNSQTILSIMAGITVDEMSEKLETSNIIRCMPNLPCQLGLGVTGFFVAKDVEINKALQIQKLIETTGLSIQLDQEQKLHTITAISGSGPAYIFYFMNAMIEQAQAFGYSTAEASSMVTQTFLGAAELFKQNNITCEEWMNRVASKGGTTEAALQVFHENNLSKIIQKGILAAHNRSEEMSQIK